MEDFEGAVVRAWAREATREAVGGGALVPEVVERSTVREAHALSTVASSLEKRCRAEPRVFRAPEARRAALMAPRAAGAEKATT
jgi:hypothetical protein